MLRKAQFVFVFAWAAMVGGIFVVSAGAQDPVAEWTVMLYMDADNNLEDPQMVDLQEMMSAGSTEKVNFVVLADRSLKGDNERGYTDRPVGGIKNWTGTKLFVIEKGKLREIADWGEANMGDPANLKRFLDTATAEFPAKRYGLVFGDHGAGWVGIGGDESAGGDNIDTTEMPGVLKSLTARTGKFEFIGFDACLMANFEMAKVLSPFANFMIASEELEPGDGWDYAPLFGALVANPAMDGAMFGRTNVDGYKRYYLGASEGNREMTVTLSVIDLARIPALETAVNNLGIFGQSFIRSGGRDNWLKTARARSSSEEYGIDGDDHMYFYDLADFALNLKREAPSPDAAKAADAVASAVKAAVIYKVNGEARPRSSGMSIYFPGTVAEANGDYQKTPYSLSGKWLPFLGDYLTFKAKDVQAPKIEKVESTEPQVAEKATVTVTAQVNGDDLDEATFVLAERRDGEDIIIGAIPTEPDEKGVLSEEWDGDWFSIGDGTKEVICPITGFEQVSEAEETYLVEVPAQVRYNGSDEWIDATLFFSLDFNQEEVKGEFVYAFDSSRNQPREIELEAGDSIRPVYLAIDDKGESNLVASDDEADIFKVEGDAEIAVGRMSVAPGKYLIGFTATDFAGNTSEEFTEVDVK